MTKTHYPPYKRERGQSLVEVGITLTVLIMLLAGVVDFGNAFFTYVALSDAAQEGAVYGSIAPYIDSNANGKYDTGEPGNVSAIAARVRNASSDPIDLSDPAVGVSVAFLTRPCERNEVQVTVTFDYEITMPFISGIIGQDTIPLTAVATDTILQPVCP